MTGSQASSGSGARPRRRSSQAAAEDERDDERDVDPGGRSAKEQLGSDADEEGDGQQAPGLGTVHGGGLGGGRSIGQIRCRAPWRTAVGSGT